MRELVRCQVAVTIQDGNVGPDLGDVGDGVETGAALPRDESGPNLTSFHSQQASAAQLYSGLLPHSSRGSLFAAWVCETSACSRG
jgi:hypothetical protein